MVPTDVVRVSEPAMCTLRLSVRVFTLLPDGGEKTQNPGSDILNLGSRKFWKVFENTFLYITVGSFDSEVFISGSAGPGLFVTPLPPPPPMPAPSG